MFKIFVDISLESKVNKNNNQECMWDKMFYLCARVLFTLGFVNTVNFSE
jgi:hypothetical protein